MPQGTTQQLDDAVEEVMALMFERACTPAPGLPSTFPATSTHICLSDPLSGASSLFIDLEFAQQLTSALLQKPISEIPKVMVIDTVGEICNMITGSWKARQPPDLAISKLSPPMENPVRTLQRCFDPRLQDGMHDARLSARLLKSAYLTTD